MKILIVDDEQLARERLVDLISEIEPSHQLFEAGNGAEAISSHNENQADVILLDIRMPVMDGLEAAMHLSKLESPPIIVFTTAYEDHALDAFEANAIDYLLKPIKSDRLQAALEKSHTMRQGQDQSMELANVSAQRTHLSAKTALGIKVIPLTEIQYFKAEQKYVSGFYPGGELVLDETLKSLENEFTEQLLRIHRNTLVSKSAVQSLERDVTGNAMIKLTGLDELLSVSRRHLNQVKQFLKSKAG